jgi:hypothetical protein
MSDEAKDSLSNCYTGRQDLDDFPAMLETQDG